MSVVALAAVSGWITVDQDSYIRALLYLYNFEYQQSYSVVLGHTWSLAVEEQFYLVLPFLVLLAPRSKVGMWLAVGTVLLLIAHIGVIGVTSLETRMFVERWPTATFPTLFLGCMLGWLVAAERPTTKWIIRHGPLLLGAATMLYCASLWMWTPVGVLTEIAVYNVRSVGVALFLLWIVTRPTSGFVEFLERPLLRTIGRMSYGIYLWQGLFLTTGPRGWLSVYDTQSSVLQNVEAIWELNPLLVLQMPPLNLLFTFAFATVSYLTIERYSQKLKARMTLRGTGVNPVLAGPRAAPLSD